MAAQDEGRWFPIAPGIVRRTLVAGERMMQILVTLEAGSQLPLHSHPHEQVSHVLRGRLRFHIAGERRELGPGESLCIAGGVPHAADVLEEALVVDTFSPPREDLLAQDQAED
ncbi:MAG TPA: cupin domain-containing protein [Roseiflexaceae bacterium]|nr:cupin domain-containing protein [Roseiflexaceae bacterium]